MTVTRRVALSLVVLLATAANVVSRAAGTPTTVGARLTACLLYTSDAADE